MEKLILISITRRNKTLLNRYAEYPAPAHDQPMYFPYEPSPTSQRHTPLSSKQ